jgi:hypothetical protein
MNRRIALLTFFANLSILAFAEEKAGEPVEYLEKMELQGAALVDGNLVLDANGKISTAPKKFKPPVEITIEAKTDLNSLRIGYAADQVIFNWENNPRELRIDGGPGAGNHRLGAGSIRPKKFATIRWVVTPKRQSIYVDGQQRLTHSGDYSEVNNPVIVFAVNSKITVKSIKVKDLGTEAR